MHCITGFVAQITGTIIIYHRDNAPFRKSFSKFTPWHFNVNEFIGTGIKLGKTTRSSTCSLSFEEKVVFGAFSEYIVWGLNAVATVRGSISCQ